MHVEASRPSPPSPERDAEPVLAGDLVSEVGSGADIGVDVALGNGVRDRRSSRTVRIG
jgi:hypothetical protein